MDTRKENRKFLENAGYKKFGDERNIMFLPDLAEAHGATGLSFAEFSLKRNLGWDDTGRDTELTLSRWGRTGEARTMCKKVCLINPSTERIKEALEFLGE